MSATGKTPKVVVSYGMGEDSTAILFRWMEEPETRPCPWEDIVVVTAMVGDEFQGTRELVERHVLPKFREHGVRFVQVARGGLLERDGYVVLDDSTKPQTLHFDGVYRLSQELEAAATIPTTGGCRKCSLKYKGFVIDGWLRDNVGDAPYDHVIGFNAEEMRRVKKDQVYGAGGNRTPSYPLVEWGWGRAKCEEYNAVVAGEPWAKSACGFCPFSQGKDGVLGRFKDEPEAAAQAIELERVALSFNPRMKLYRTKSVEALVAASGNARALGLVAANETRGWWAVYRLRRGMLPKKGDPTKRGTTQRGIERVSPPMMMTEALKELRIRAVSEGATVEGRVAEVRDTGEGFPRIEERLVVAPVTVQTKLGRWGAEKFEAFMERVEEALLDLAA